MNKFTNQFWKYAICLLVVGVILVAIGGLSVSRTTIANKRELALNMTYKEKVAAISNENLTLKQENKTLKEENQTLTDTANLQEKKAQTAEAFIKMSIYVEKEEYEAAKKELGKIDAALLPAEAQEQFSMYQQLLQENED